MNKRLVLLAALLIGAMVVPAFAAKQRWYQWSNSNTSILYDSTTDQLDASSLLVDSDRSDAIDVTTSGGTVVFTVDTSTPRITMGATILPRADSSYDLGSSGVRWANIYSDSLTTTSLSAGASSFSGAVSISDGAVGTPSLTNTGDTDSGVYFPAADTFALVTGGTEALRIDDSQNIAVHVTPEAWHSSFVGFQTGGLGAIYANDAQVAGVPLYIGNNVYWSSDVERYIVGSEEATRYSQENGEHNFRTAGTGSADGVILWTVPLSITSAGHLVGAAVHGWSLRGVAATGTVPVFCPDATETTTGIGSSGFNVFSIINTGTETAKFEVNGITFNDPLLLPDGAVGAPSLTNTGDTNTGLYFPADDTIAFTLAGTEAVRISTAGVGINDPTANGNLAGGLTIKNGTAASAAVTDGVQLWAADANGAAGHSGLHMRGEDDALNLVVCGYAEESGTSDTGPTNNHTPGTIVEYDDTDDNNGDGTYILKLDGTTWLKIR